MLPESKPVMVVAWSLVPAEREREGVRFWAYLEGVVNKICSQTVNGWSKFCQSNRKQGDREDCRRQGFGREIQALSLEHV